MRNFLMVLMPYDMRRNMRRIHSSNFSIPIISVLFFNSFFLFFFFFFNLFNLFLNQKVIVFSFLFFASLESLIFVLIDLFASDGIIHLYLEEREMWTIRQ